MSETEKEARKRQQLEAKADRLYRFIHTYLKENARGPSHREMAKHLRCSSKTVGALLNHLEQTGRAIHRVKGCWRRIWVPMSQMPDEEG